MQQQQQQQQQFQANATGSPNIAGGQQSQTGSHSYTHTTHSTSGFAGGLQNGTMQGMPAAMGGTMPANQALHVNTVAENKYATIGGQQSGSQGWVLEACTQVGQCDSFLWALHDY